MSNLVTCPDCGHQVSSRAPSCPNCGAPFDAAAQTVYVEPPEPRSAGFGTGFKVGCGVIAAILFVIVVVPVGCTMCTGAAVVSSLENLETDRKRSRSTGRTDWSERGPATKVITVSITNKRYDPENIPAAVWWDINYRGDRLEKPVRSFKGALRFYDLFGELKFSVNTTVSETLVPGDRVVEEGSGFRFNRFIRAHVWMRDTELKDMRYAFKVEQILYADGTTKTFKD